MVLGLVAGGAGDILDGTLLVLGNGCAVVVPLGLADEAVEATVVNGGDVGDAVVVFVALLGDLLQRPLE